MMVDAGDYPVPPPPPPPHPPGPPTPDARDSVVLIFGGTFDPPHRAHLELPIAARDAIGADWLLYVPAGRSPFKKHNPVASDADRVAMLRAGLEGVARVSISTIELESDHSGERPPSYTVETLERLRSKAPGSTSFRLLIGADQASGFHRWREPERIIELAEPVVMLRVPHESRDALLESLRAHWPDDDVDRWKRRIMSLPTIDVSATRARELLALGAFDSDELRGAIPSPVLDYIRKRDLYGPE